MENVVILKTNEPIQLELRVTDLFGQEKDDITSVNFRVYHRNESDVIIEDVETTAMSGSQSLWYYRVATGLPNAGQYIIEYKITDDDSVEYIQTEDLTVGYMQDEIELIKDIESGKWEIKDNMMIFYREDGTTEVAKFNLFDAQGKPSMEEVFKRERIV